MDLLSESSILIRQSRITLRRVTPADEEEFTRLARCSRSLHGRWVYLPQTSTEFAEYASRFQQGSSEGLLVCIAQTGALAGFINFNEVVYGIYRRALLGYGAFAPSSAQGYMTEGLTAAAKFAFENLDLHRLEADVQPGNSRSTALIERVGFRQEGFSPAFVKINGTWRDHERWALTRDRD